MSILEGFAQPKRQASADFYNKVLSLFGLSILVTGLGVYAGFHYVMPAFLANPLLIYAVLGAELLLIFTSHWWSRKAPLNVVLFSTFTFLSGLSLVPILVSFAAEFGGYEIIYRSLFATTVTFMAMGLLGYSIKKPLTGLGGFLFAGLIGLLVVGIANFFLPWGNTGEMIYSAFGVLIFAGYAMVDINRLKHYPEDAHVDAAIRLYLDIFNLFIFILRLTGAVSRD